MIASAAEVGVGAERELWRMTAAELGRAIAAHRRRQERELELIDLIGWLAGSYAAVGMHAPKRYPKRPNGLKSRKTMTDDEMKRAAVAFAARHTGGERHGNDTGDA